MCASTLITFPSFCVHRDLVEDFSPLACQIQLNEIQN